MIRQFLSRWSAGLLMFVLYLQSCTTPREFVYFNDLAYMKDTLLGPIQPFREQLIQQDDLLSIQVSALNPEDVQMFNATGLSTQGAGGNVMMDPQTRGFLVDKSGNVSLPYIGEFKAQGLTIREMELFVVDRLRKYVKEPVVRVRFLNHFISVLGEVNRPAMITMSFERLTLSEVLAQVGDLRATAIRNNILVVRESNGYRTTGRVDLLSKTVFENPYYYMQNRDVIYVEPVQASYVNRTDRVSRFLGPISAILSIGLSLFAVLTR
jgi:polysaccharide export outer membrane protein